MADTEEIQTTLGGVNATNPYSAVGGIGDAVSKPSPADMQRIFEDSKKFSAQFAGFVKAAEVIGALGSVEQAVAEAQTRLKQQKDAEVKAAADHKAAAAARAMDHAAELKRLDAELAAKRIEGLNFDNAARAQAAIIVEEANKIVRRVKADADENLAKMAEGVQAHRDELQRLQKDIADHEMELADLDKQVQDKRAKLKEVADEHARFLAKIGAR